MMSSTCEGCIYSVPAMSDEPDEGPLMFCHRYPPTLLVLPNDEFSPAEVIQAQPQTTDGCGEYQRAPKEYDA